MTWVFNHSRATGTDRLVLLAIADSANDYGQESWPSLSTIARKAGIDRRTVSRSLARLEELGELRRARSGRLGAGGVSNSYTVVMEVGAGRHHPDAPALSTGGGEVPLGAEDPQGQSAPEVGASRPRGRGEMPPDPSLSIQNHPLRAALVDNVVEAIADLRLAKRQQTGQPLASPERWRASVIRSFDASRVCELVDRFDEPASTLAEAHEGMRQTRWLKQRTDPSQTGEAS